MQTREEAVRWLREQGLFANTRDWSIGQSVCVWTSQETDPKTGITVCQGMIYLYPEDGVWHLSDPSTQLNDTICCGTLSDAAREVVERIQLKRGANP